MVCSVESFWYDVYQKMPLKERSRYSASVVTGLACDETALSRGCFMARESEKSCNSADSCIPWRSNFEA